jgi:hypothetical protein
VMTNTRPSWAGMSCAVHFMAPIIPATDVPR